MPPSRDAVWWPDAARVGTMARRTVGPLSHRPVNLEGGAVRPGGMTPRAARRDQLIELLDVSGPDPGVGTEGAPTPPVLPRPSRRSMISIVVRSLAWSRWRAPWPARNTQPM